MNDLAEKVYVSPETDEYAMVDNRIKQCQEVSVSRCRITRRCCTTQQHEIMNSPAGKLHVMPENHDYTMIGDRIKQIQEVDSKQMQERVTIVQSLAHAAFSTPCALVKIVS